MTNKVNSLTCNKLCCSRDQPFTAWASVSHAITWIFQSTNQCD